MIRENFPYAAIVEHCISEFPTEACGLVIQSCGKYRYIPCANIKQSEDEFDISCADWAKAEDEGSVIAVVHSHTDGNSTPSKWDYKAHEVDTEVDWLIIGLSSKECIPSISWIQQEQNTPLLEREYVWQEQDCGTLIRDFYKQQFNILLPDYYRKYKFWEDKQEIYFDVFANAGFYEIRQQDLDYGDVILFALGTDITTHGAVYIGSNKIIHHYRNRLSSIDTLNEYYLNKATKFLRHKDIQNAKNNKTIRSIG